MKKPFSELSVTPSGGVRSTVERRENRTNVHVESREMKISVIQCTLRNESPGY